MERSEHAESTERDDECRTDWNSAPFGYPGHDREYNHRTGDAPQQNRLVIGAKGVDRELADRSRGSVDEERPDCIKGRCIRRDGRCRQFAGCQAGANRDQAGKPVACYRCDSQLLSLSREVIGSVSMRDSAPRTLRMVMTSLKKFPIRTHPISAQLRTCSDRPSDRHTPPQSGGRSRLRLRTRQQWIGQRTWLSNEFSDLQ